MPHFKTGEVTKRGEKKLIRTLRNALLTERFLFTIENQLYLGSVHFNDTVFNLIICHCKKKLFQIPTSNFNSLTFIPTDVTPQCQNRFLD